MFNEHLALELAATYSSQLPTVYSDCASVVRSSQDRVWAEAHARPFAAIWRDLPHVPQVVKTKAHRRYEDVQDDAAELHAFWGNLAAVAGMFAGLSGVLLAAVLWVAA